MLRIVMGARTGFEWAKNDSGRAHNVNECDEMPSRRT